MCLGKKLKSSKSLGEENGLLYIVIFDPGVVEFLRIGICLGLVISFPIII